MFKRQVKAILRSQKGFTLIELLAVMAIVAVLAGIVSTSVSGSGESATIATAQTDASTVNSAVGTFFADQEATEVKTTKTVLVVADIASDIDIDPDSDTIGAIDFDAAIDLAATDPDDPSLERVQEKSSGWPELYLTENSDTADTSDAVSIYENVFPTSVTTTDNIVIRVIVADSDGLAINRIELLEGYTSVDLDALRDGGYLAAVPASFDETIEVDVGQVTVEIPTFLWLFRKNTTAGGAEDNSRVVSVFILADVQVEEVFSFDFDDDLQLTYAQIF